MGNKIKKKILIVGGTGFIGYHLAKACLKKKWDVTSISLNKPKKIRKLIGVNYLTLDISNKRNFKRLKNTKFNYVINSGGHVDHFNKKKAKRHHFLAVKNLFEYFCDKKIEKFIQIGSSTEYGKTAMPQKEDFSCKPISIYGKNKLKGSNFLIQKYRNSNFPVTILRLYQVYGPNQDTNRFLPDLIQSCLMKNFFYTSNGIQKRDFLFISDAVNAFLKTLNSNNTNGQIINIGYGKSFVLKNLMFYVGKKTKYFSPIYGKVKLRKDEGLNIYPEIKKSKKLLNWKPKIHWKEGILKTIKYFKSINEKNTRIT